jgi:hypothetical protein
MASPGHGSVHLVTAEDICLVVDSVPGLVCTVYSPNEVELLNPKILRLFQTDFLQPDPKGDHFAAWVQPKLSPLNSELRSEHCAR